jgi:hypothetical protein
MQYTLLKILSNSPRNSVFISVETIIHCHKFHKLLFMNFAGILNI